MNIAVVTCDVLTDEVRHFCGQLPGVKLVEVLEQGLHSTPDLLRAQLQESITRIEQDPGIDAIVLGYGLCSRGIEGICAHRCRLVVARAHDCITLLLGSKERYAEYVRLHPGTYWYSQGWNRTSLMPGKQRYDKVRGQYVEKYGEDNADFLMEAEQGWMREYNRATFVDLGVTDTKEAKFFTEECAGWLGWNYDEQQGDPRLLRDLLAGRWDSARFLVLNPGESVRFTVDDAILAAMPCKHCAGNKNAA